MNSEFSCFLIFYLWEPEITKDMVSSALWVVMSYFNLGENPLRKAMINNFWCFVFFFLVDIQRQVLTVLALVSGKVIAFQSRYLQIANNTLAILFSLLKDIDRFLLLNKRCFSSADWKWGIVLICTCNATEQCKPDFSNSCNSCKYCILQNSDFVGTVTLHRVLNEVCRVIWGQIK